LLLDLNLVITYFIYFQQPDVQGFVVMQQPIQWNCMLPCKRKWNVVRRSMQSYWKVCQY